MGHPTARHLARPVGALLALFLAAGPLAAQTASPGDAVALGRHLVQIAGCNDCHTPGYAMAAGRVDEKEWLTGDPLGWRGPWGTTYAVNLRLYFAGLSEAQWLENARRMEPRPPMPWWNLRAMSDQELGAIYRYVRGAGPAGRAMPAALPPGQAPAPPFVQFP